MYAVKCYRDNGSQFGDTDYFNNFDDAYTFAEDMARDLLVDIITPSGVTVCLN
jgi:hypothetical protein